MSFRFWDGTLPRYPLTLALPRLFITKAIVFSAIIQCIQDFSVCLFLHRNISYICHVQTSHPPAPFNKICLITITNFFYFFFLLPTIKAFDPWSQKVSPSADAWLRLRESCASIVQQLYTQWWKKKNYRHNTSAWENTKSICDSRLVEAVTDKLNTLTDARLSRWLAGAMLPPHGLKRTLQQVDVSDRGQLPLSSPIAQVIFQRWKHIHIFFFFFLKFSFLSSLSLRALAKKKKFKLLYSVTS